METDGKIARPSLRVFAVLFLAYLVTHVALLRFVYGAAPATAWPLAELAAIAGGALAARVIFLVWRRTART